MGTPRVRLLGIFGTAMTLLVLMIYATSLTSQPTFCGSCHEMSTYLSSWESSTHSNISCISCHRLSILDKGIMLSEHFTVKDLTVGAAPVQCLSCHKESRVITPSGDLLIPHRLHLEQHIPCANCHPGAGHLSGQIVEAPKSLASKYPTEVMALCLKCHYKNNGTISCRSCHARPTVTLAHLQPGWGSNHGNSAFKELAQCNKCHQYTLFLDENRPNSAVQALSSPAAYCRDNAFCADCHKKRPPSHVKYFTYEHPALAVTREDDCLVCHQWNFPLPVESAPRLYCQKCHIYRGWVPLPFTKLKNYQLIVKEPGK